MPRMAACLSVSDVAPHNTVRDRLSRGRKQLKEKIRKDPTLAEWMEEMKR